MMNFFKITLIAAVMITAVSAAKAAEDPAETSLKTARALGINSKDAASGKTLDQLERELMAAKGQASQGAAIQALKAFRSEGDGRTIQEEIDSLLAIHKPGSEYDFVPHEDIAAIIKFHDTLRKVRAAAPSATTKEQIAGGKFLAGLKEAIDNDVVELPSGASINDVDINETLISMITTIAVQIDTLRAQALTAEEDRKKAAAAAARRPAASSLEDHGLPLFDW